MRLLTRTHILPKIYILATFQLQEQTLLVGQTPIMVALLQPHLMEKMYIMYLDKKHIIRLIMVLHTDNFMIFHSPRVFLM